MQEDLPIAQLERALEDLARRFERFFGRDPQVTAPPELARARLERRLYELSREEGRTTAEQFKLDQLQHRFATLNQLWRRQLREREEARGARPVTAANAGEVASVDGKRDELEGLFAAYAARMRRAGGPNPLTLAAFKTALRGQREKLEAQGFEVEGFEVVEKGGDVKVRARARRRRQE